MRISFFSIKIRALMLVGLVFIMMTGMLTYITLAARERNVARAMVSLQANAERIASEQNNILNYGQQLVTVLLQTNDFSEFSSSPGCHEFLASIVIQDPRIANIVIADPNGDYVCNASEVARRINIADRVHFKKALTSPDTVTGEAVIGRSTGKWGLPFAKAIRDKAGRLHGVLVVFVDLHWVSRELGKTEHTHQGARIGLIDYKGTVLARQPDPENWIGKNAAQTAFFKTLISHNGTGTAEAPGFDGIIRIYGFSRFAETASGPIYLWLGVSKNLVMAPVYLEFAWTMSLALMFLLIAFILTWVGSERLILFPISAIVTAARNLGQGQQNARTGLHYSNDELGQLAKTFDEMASALSSQNELLRLNRALKLLSACNMVLVHAENEQELLNSICRLSVETGGYLMAWVGFADNDDAKSVRPVAQSGYEEGYLESIRVSWADNELGQGPTGTAIRTGTASLNQSYLTNPKMAPWREAALKRGYQSSIALPIISNKKTLGALAMYAADPIAFTKEEVVLLEELAADLAFGIEALRTRAEREHYATSLQQSLEQSIQAVAATLEARNPYTAGHQKRVAELAVAIAQEMGLPDDQVHGIKLAAIIHDLGKIHIPAEILSKPVRLSDIEFAIIKTHPQQGYDILRGVKFPWPIADIIWQHHERLDGSGYPQGLKGDQILLEARIIAVADIVEAMASHRPYRPGFGIEAALEQIKGDRGRLFDSIVVDACLRLFGEKGFTFGDNL